MRFSLAFIAASVPFLASAAPLRRAAGASDILVFTFADVLEQLESQFYREAIAKFKDADFTGAGFMSAQIPMEQFSNILFDESTHSTVLQAALKSFGAEPVTTCKFDFTAALADVPTMLATARVVEQVGVGAYLGGATLITDPVLLDAAGSILTIEARHQTILNVLSAGSAIPAAFDIPLSPSEVLALAGPFIANPDVCDLGIPANTPLSITNTGVVGPGTKLEFAASTINGTIPESNLFCQMLVGGLANTISLPLSECIVPEGINGGVAIWITSDSQPLINNIRDRAVTQQVAGPAIAFVDTRPEIIGSLLRGGSPTVGAGAATTTQIISPEDAAKIVADAAAGSAAGGAAAPAAGANPNVPVGGSTVTGLSGDGSVEVAGWGAKLPAPFAAPAKRSTRRQIPAEVATKSVNGVITPYKRQIPAEVATKSVNGVITPYKRSVARQIPAEVATKSVNGVITPY